VLFDTLATSLSLLQMQEAHVEVLVFALEKQFAGMHVGPILFVSKHIDHL